MALFELLYVSTQNKESAYEVAAILESSVRHNKRNAITGMLLYCGGNFMQVLEGDEVDVMETYSRIQNDKRHHDVMNLMASEIPSRNFDKWSMGFKHISASEVAKLPQYAPFFDLNKQSLFLEEKPSLALEMLRVFNASNN
jgi:hypothetical protein